MNTFEKTNAKLSLQFKYYPLIIMLSLTMILTADVVVYKLVLVGGFKETGGTLVAPLFYIIGDIIAEVYGFQLAKRMIWYTVVCDLIFTSMITLIVHIPGPAHWPYQQEFKDVLGSLFRLGISGTCGLLISSFINAYIITRSKILFAGRFFWLRSLIASSIGELILSIVGFTIAFLGKIPFLSILELMLSAWVFKTVCNAVGIIPASLSVTWLKRHESFNVIEQEVDFNPFSLNIDKD